MKFGLKNGDVKEFSSTGLDLIGFNREMLKHDFSEVSWFEVGVYGSVVRVDLVSQEVLVDGVVVDLELENKLSSVRWVHFRRNVFEIKMVNGSKSKVSEKIGIGFQGNLGGVNVQRFLLFDKSGFELVKKGDS